MIFWLQNTKVGLKIAITIKFGIFKGSERLFMPQKLITSLIFTLLVQGLAVSASLEPQAILEQSAHSLQTGQGHLVEFKVQTQSLITGDKSEYEGVLLTGPGQEFALKTPSIQLYRDNQNFWNYNTRSQQVLVKPAASTTGALGPSQALLQYLECEPMSLDSQKLGTQPVWHLKLKPSESLQQFAEIEVWLDQETLKPLKLRIMDYSENEVQYDILKFEPNPTQGMTQFQWKPVTGVELIDMR